MACKTSSCFDLQFVTRPSGLWSNEAPGASLKEIADWFDIMPQQIKAVLEFAARSLDAPAHEQP
jgi:hypothetical protein